MSRLLALSALLAVLALPSAAAADDSDDEVEQQQSYPERDVRYFGRFHLGVIGGPALTLVSADDADFQEASTSVIRYSVGVHVEYRVYRGLGLALEPLFSRRAWNTEGAFLNRERDVLYEFSYLDLPLLVQYGLPVAGRVAPRVGVGPFGRLFVEGSRGAERTGPFIGDDQRTDIDRTDVNDFHAGLVAGVGADIDLPEQILSIDIRYMHDFTDIFDNPVDGADNVRHRSVLAMVGLLF